MRHAKADVMYLKNSQYVVLSVWTGIADDLKWLKTNAEKEDWY